ncbi:alpha-mannosidase 2x-like [Clavelina lepadiformis]|uniref:alpha-mannosidase 2x-like n=1 Tax=Clavelina lepadiformis TaxID=159417 RepID=UPI0040417C72
MVFLRRKLTFIIGTVLFFVSLMFMISQLDSPATSPRAYNDQQDQVHILQSKLQNLEKELEHNKDALDMVRVNMDKMLKIGNVHDALQRKELEDLIRLPAEQGFRMQADIPKFHVRWNASSDKQVCQALSYTGSNAEIDMIDVCEKLPFANLDGGVWKQGYPIDTSDAEWVGQKLRVFVVPHSHNDPGWLKTVDKYFLDQTQHILNNIMDVLSQDPVRKFIWAEMSYFSMWWDIATPERKEKAKKLVANGQLEMVTAGWVMNDEANTHYFAMIDQMIEGNEWLSRTIGITPRSGWAIDPFGHSSTMAYILKKMEFENMLIQRVHYAIKKQLSLQKSLEFRWRQAWASDESTDILCHMMPFYSYDVPHTCGPDPKICCQFDFARLPGTKLNCPWKIAPVAINEGNVAQRAALLLDQYRKKSKLFKSNTLLVILGDDFRYSLMKETVDQFENYAKIFAHVNSHPELNAELQFGTLSDYFDALKADLGGADKLPTLRGDFFTYADREDHYWSGYYTSRPFHKMQERVLESHLRGAEILFSLALSVTRKSGMSESFASTLFPLLVQARQDLGLFQHHDGITGTERDHVLIDYGNRLMRSVTNSKRIMAASAQMLLVDSSSFDSNTHFFDMDEVYNAQNQPPTPTVIKIPSESNNAATVVLYNSLAYERTGVISLNVNIPNVIVRSSAGEVIQSQINPVWSDNMQFAADQYQLLLLATIPATGLTMYTISAGESSFASTVQVYNVDSITGLKSGPFEVSSGPAGDSFELQNEYLVARFATTNGFLQSLTNMVDGTFSKVGINFVTYTSRMSKDKSGAYLFLPAGEAQPHVGPDQRPLVRVMRGPIASEVNVVLPNLIHSVTVYSGDGRGSQPLGLHVCNKVDIRSGYDNKEIAMRLKTDVQSGRNFYTDLNGFQMQKRTYYEKLPLQANFYPMPTTVYIQDREKRLSLLTAQPLGVGSLREGEMDVILDRRLMQDDNRGLGQPVKDNVLTPESFVILIEKWDQAATDKSTSKFGYPSLAAHNILWEMLHPVRSFSVQQTLGDAGPMKPRFQPLKDRSWPCDLHLLNLRAIHSKTGKFPTDETALLLHRVGYECSLESHKHFKPSCHMSEGTQTQSVPVTSIFSVSSVQTSSLSLQKDGHILNSDSTLKVPPMEIEAFKVKLM